MQEEQQSILLYLFDVDGTLVTTRSGETFRKTADDWQWISGRKEVLQRLVAQDKIVSLVTNQGGIAFGYFDFDDMLGELQSMVLDFYPYRPVSDEPGIPVEHWMQHLEICSTHPNATDPLNRKENDFYRKPNPGMLIRQMAHFEITPQQTLMVGDRNEDFRAAHRCGCNFAWTEDFFSPQEHS